jgi:hypothetical protein
MTPQQAKIIAAWEELHPHCYVKPSAHHVPQPHDPWRYIIHQADNDMVLGAVSREKYVARHAFNEALTSQLRDCLMTGRMPRPLAQTRVPTPLVSPEGVLTAHPSPEDLAQPTQATRPAPWDVTPLQERILAAWEGLHGEFRVVADVEHKPARFEAWKWRVERKADSALVATVTKFTQEVIETGCTEIVEQLRSSLKTGHVPAVPCPRPSQRRDPLTGQILPKLRPPEQPKAPESTSVLADPSRPEGPDNLMVRLPPGSTEGWPKPWPTCGEEIVMTGEAARFRKYGNHPEDWTEFGGHVPPRLKPKTKEYDKARKIVGKAMVKARKATGTREELTDAARLANQMGDKESAHVLALLATKTRPASGTAAGFDDGQ